VLVIAGVGVPRDCFHSRNIAPTNAGPRMSNIGAAQYMHDELNVKRLVCIVPNIPNVGDWVCDGLVAYGELERSSPETVAPVLRRFRSSGARRPIDPHPMLDRPGGHWPASGNSPVAKGAD